MKVIKLKGSALIGFFRTRTILTSFIVDKQNLIIDVMFRKKIIINTTEIISIEISRKALWNKGIKINHKNNSYPKNIRFHSHVNPQDLIKQMINIGFINKNQTNL